MKKYDSTIKFKNFGVLLLIFVLCFAFPSTAQESVSTAADPRPARFDFSNYQQSLDDLFQIGLTANLNPDFGANKVIVSMNRRLSENPHDSEALMNLGHVYRIMGLAQEANRFYNRALQEDPNQFHLNVFAGISSLERADFERALRDFEHALVVHPMDADVWAMKARALFALVRIPEAIQSYEKVLSLNPVSEEAVYVLSLYYQKEGRGKDSLRLIQSFLRKRPENSFARFHLGALYLLQKKPGKALPIFQQLFQQGARDLPFLLQYAVANIETKNLGKAEIILRHLQFFHPRVDDIDFLLAEVYRQMGRLHEAEEKYREIITLDPKFLSAAVGLAITLKQDGRTREGMQVLKDAGLEPLNLNTNSGDNGSSSALHFPFS